MQPKREAELVISQLQWSDNCFKTTSNYIIYSGHHNVSQVYSLLIKHQSMKRKSLHVNFKLKGSWPCRIAKAVVSQNLRTSCEEALATNRQKANYQPQSCLSYLRNNTRTWFLNQTRPGFHQILTLRGYTAQHMDAPMFFPNLTST